MSVEPSDQALLAGFATGDPRTAAAFVRRFQGRVYGLALTIVRQPAVAEEVAQETFTRVYRHAGNYDARKGRVSTWLLSIARNLAIDQTRMKRLDPVDPDVIAAEVSIESQPPGADEVGLQPDERAQLRSAIGDLPDHQRRALVLAPPTWAGPLRRSATSTTCRWEPSDTRIRTAMLEAPRRARGTRVMDSHDSRSASWRPSWRSAPSRARSAGGRSSTLPTAPTAARHVEKLSEVADELLLLAPRREPPVGFESRVLGGVLPAPQPKRRRRWRLVLAPAAAAVAAAVIVLAIVAPDLRLASHYRHTLDTAARQGVRVLRHRGSEWWLCRDGFQLRGITLLGPHRRQRRSSRGPDQRRAGHQGRRPGATAVVPPRFARRGLRRLDPDGPEAGLGPAAHRRAGHAAARRACFGS